MITNPAPLPESFYRQPVLKAAEKLLGKVLVRKIDETIIRCRVVEVEAYDGSCDRAAHSFGGKTKRNEVMFREGGCLYVYFTYGMYYCANIVTGAADEGRAVLIRGLEPMDNLEILAKNRFGTSKIENRDVKNLTNGPGKICMALSINLDHNGMDLTEGDIFLTSDSAEKDFEICVSERIGITRSKELEWRFFIRGNKFVSGSKIQHQKCRCIK